MTHIFNLLTGEIIVTDDPDSYLNKLLIWDPKLLIFLFHDNLYVAKSGTINIQYCSSVGTIESVVYRLNEHNIETFVNYLEDKEDQGAIIQHLW